METMYPQQFKNIYELLNYIQSEQKMNEPLKPYEQKFKVLPQNDCLNYVRSGAYIVGSIDFQGNFSFSNNPVTHANSSLARAECARLAKLHPGKAFVFVKLAGAEMVPMAQTISI